MNKIVRHNLGFNIVIGIQGNKEFLKGWETLIHNYSLAENIHPEGDSFFYFITNVRKFVTRYGIFIQNQYFKNGLCKADEIKYFERTARIEARDQLDNFTQESFYHYYNK